MRKFKIVMFSVLCVAIASLFAVEIFAAVYLNVRLTGNIEFRATDIGAKIWGTKTLNDDGVDGVPSYLTLSGEGDFSNDVYYVAGEAQSYSNITATIGTTSFTSANDNVEIYLFIKNVGDRYIIPNVSVETSNTDIVTENICYYFDLSLGHKDPLQLKEASLNASEFMSSIDSEINSSNYSPFTSNSSMDNDDVFCIKVVVKISDSVQTGGSVQVSSQIFINIGFMADVQYESNDILSVYQNENQDSPEWVKYGYNSTLEAGATKIEENNLSNLELYLRQTDSNGNPNISVSRDDYHNAIVYKDIDNVNVDIKTGELIGWLSDINYNFEWFGRDVTLPAGTTLASGRTLTTSETFTVDVYTKYPTMYVRRWVVGGEQWLSVSDKYFTGSVKIDEFYTATFESTLFNPDKSVATNEYGIITRSYVTDYVPMTSGSAEYLQTNYGYKTVDQNGSSVTITTTTPSRQFLAWATNLTKAWEDASLSASYKVAKGVQGENWTTFVYNILYLVKYANNNSQAMVGHGNTYSYTLYNQTGVTVKTTSGNSITTGGNSVNSYYESEKGSGSIGVYNPNSIGSATYDTSNKMSSTGYNNAGMNYGFNSGYTYGSDKTGLYSQQFLTYSNGTEKYLLDGYVGSDKYTSVFCLGMCNPWGNVWKQIMGTLVLSDGTNIYAYISFDDYDYEAGNWRLTSSASSFASLESAMINNGYVKLSYSLPSINGVKKYLGTSDVSSSTAIETLIGLPTSSSDSVSSENYDLGLSDIYMCKNLTGDIYGILHGGYTQSTLNSGIFNFRVEESIGHNRMNVGFRQMLIM